jgi:hypothetical protein
LISSGCKPVPFIQLLPDRMIVDGLKYVIALIN